MRDIKSGAKPSSRQPTRRENFGGNSSVSATKGVLGTEIIRI